MSDIDIILEKICDRQLIVLDSLNFTQRLILQQLLMFVKNGHTCKYTYKLTFKKIIDMIRKTTEKGAKDYQLRGFIADLHELSKKRVCFAEVDGREREYAWVTNVDIDHVGKCVRYNFCKDLSKTCLTYEGKRFVLQLLDFAAIESREGKRMYRFLSGCKNRTVTTHRVSALLKYFFVDESISSEYFLETVINPAISELNQKVMFIFKNIKAQLVTKGDEDFVEIVFFTVVDKHLPRGCKVGK